MTVARRVAAYSTAAVASAALVERAQAVPIPYTPPGGAQTVELGESTFLDIDGDGQPDYLLFGSSSQGNFRISGQSGLPIAVRNSIYVDPATWGTYLAWLFAPGDMIDSALSSWFDFSQLDSFAGTRGYIGIEFDIPGGSPHFGYLDIEIDDEGQTLTVYGGAYESVANTPITVPEPSSLGLLALGAAGLAAWRCRRRREEEEVGIAGTGGVS